MPVAEGQVRDVAEFARSLLAVYGVDGSLLPETSFDEWDPDGWTSYEIALHIETDSLPGAVAVLNVFKLIVDSAAATIEYVDQTGHVGGDDIDEERLAGICALDLIGIELVALSDGSIRARFSLNPKEGSGRRRILGIGGLGSLALAFFLPHIGIPVGVGMAVAGHLNDVLTPDNVPVPAVEVADELGAVEHVQADFADQPA